jgi:hypothetical protein
MNKIVFEPVEISMKKMCAILAVVLLSPLIASRANAGPISEGPLNWTARHVRNAFYTAGDVARSAGQRIDYRAHQVRNAIANR